jgi:light-harvesting complex I chlorophyll a/b binding protein 3
MDPSNSGGVITPEWLSYSEIIHCRFAMLGAAGCIAPEVLAKVQPGFPAATDVVWFKSGVIPPAGSYDEYWTDSMSLFWVEAIAMNFAELKRLQDFKYPGSQSKHYFVGLEKIFGGSGNPAYPGGQFFNMFNLGATEAEMKKLKTNEVKNGRLAMIAMFGFGAQATLTRQGPFENLLQHLSDPVNNNILTNFGKTFGQ